ALEGMGEMPRGAPARPAGAARTQDRASEERASGMAAGTGTGPGSRAAQQEAAERERVRSTGADLGL
ncbi:MAG: hypothetical protein OXC11_05625, partial [Rhodospirillales bacterium]|nr:hypothetical protein [Rhodospirillales bacterium]